MNEAYFAMRILADEENRKKLLIIILIPILFFIVAMLAASDMGTTAGTAASGKDGALGIFDGKGGANCATKMKYSAKKLFIQNKLYTKQSIRFVYSLFF